jgi:hypothetical protein
VAGKRSPSVLHGCGNGTRAAIWDAGPATAPASEELHVFSNTITPGERRSPTVDEIERRYLDLHEGDREAAARNLAVDLIMIVIADAFPADVVPCPGTLRRYRRAAAMACGVFRLPMSHARVIHDDTVEHAFRRMLPAPLGQDGSPISRREAVALTTRRAA